MAAPHAADPDTELVERCLTDRSEEAFAALYDRYKDRVYGTAASLTGDRTLAEDVTQEVFLRIHRKLETFERRSIFSTWVYRLTVNLATDLQRGQMRVRRLNDETIELARARPERVIEDDTGLVARLAEAELRAEVAEAIRTLSEKLSVVVVLRYLEGLSYEQVADVLQVSVGTIKSRLNRAHTELAWKLREIKQRLDAGS